MKKLELVQIMQLAEKLEHSEWITVLLKLNNDGQLEKFLEMINGENLLQEVLGKTNKSRNR